ncbi:hypothetical protein PENDEC_c039G06907 [Penicillium decumbens]|uniref:Uncharacterized protein n=1 Tax=Penicillium decumbens TaxID=69771 RepID=A0A1V6NS63_PENDC|nr:hypothetical protein PENDEC_c039G06907 [Penicillium decumbens]
MAPPFVFEPLRETFLLPVTPGTQSRGTYYVTCPNCKKPVKKRTSCCGSKRAISPSGLLTEHDNFDKAHESDKPDE